MNHRPEQHLTYDDLLRTLVDKSDLGAGERTHLESCPHCQHQARRLGRRYTDIGQVARKMAPAPGQPFRLPLESGAKAGRWSFKPALALGLAGALILALTVWWPRHFNPDEPPGYMAAQSPEEERRLMQEIDALVEDALPKAYQQLASIAEPDFSQDLIDLIVPSIEEDDKEYQPQARHGGIV